MNLIAMSGISTFLQDSIGLSAGNQMKIVYSVIILVVLGLLRFGIQKLVWRLTEDPRSRYTWKRTLSFIFGFLSIVMIFGVWVNAIGQLGAFLGLLTAGIAIALKDPLTNIAGWMFIIVRKPFVLGDRIQIGEHAGDVIDIRLFQFSLLEIGNWVDADQSTGRIIHVPNGAVFQKTQANYSAGFEFIWNEMKVLVTFESNWRKAKEILQELINQHSEATSVSAERKIKEASKKYMIYYKHLSPIVYTRVEDSGVLLTLRYICDPRRRRSTENNIWEEVLESFDKHKDIEFAYPTTRFYKNNEGTMPE